MSATTRRVLRATFGTIGIAYLGWSLWSVMSEGHPVVPPLGTTAGALALTMLGIAGSGRSWAALFERPGDEGRLAAGFIVSQAAKYAPMGAAAQAAGQIGLAAGPGVTVGQAGSRFVIHAAIQAIVAAAVGGLTAFAPGVPTPARALLALGLIAPVLLVRRWLDPVLAAGVRLVRRPDGWSAALPGQSALLSSAMWSLTPTLASGIAFGLLLSGLDPSNSLLRSVPAFAASWLVGYLALPFPAGIGVREAVLAWFLGSAGGAVVAASVVHRAVTMVAELVLFVASWRRAR